MTSRAIVTVSASIFIFLTVIFTSAQALADQFNVTGKWNVTQSNGATATFNVKSQRADGGIDGDAQFGSVRGQGAGHVHGEQFLFSVEWNNGSIGEYSGTFNSMGRLSGFTFDVNHPKSQATWVASKQFKRTPF